MSKSVPKSLEIYRHDYYLRGNILHLLDNMMRFVSLVFVLFSPPFVFAAKTKVVFTQTTEIKELYDKLSYPSLVSSKVDAKVLSESQGVVTEFKVRLGQKVKKGTLLARVRHMDPVYKYRAVLHYAPVAGVVSAINVTVGGLVGKGTELLTITDPRKIRLFIEVSAIHVKHIEDKMIGMLHLPHEKNDVPVRIVGMSPVLDPATGTATAELELVNKQDHKIVRVGTLGKVTFKANIHQAISIPRHAITYDGKKPQMRIIVDGKMTRKLVVLGERREANIEVLTGLKPGDQIVVRASGYIPNGDAVKVQTK